MQGIFSGKLKVENGELIQAKEGENFLKDWKKVRINEIVIRVFLGIVSNNLNKIGLSIFNKKILPRPNLIPVAKLILPFILNFLSE